MTGRGREPPPPMSTTTGTGPVLIVCLLDCSVSLLREWSDIVNFYVTPLWKAIALASGRIGVPDTVRLRVAFLGITLDGN